MPSLSTYFYLSLYLPSSIPLALYVFLCLAFSPFYLKKQNIMVMLTAGVSLSSSPSHSLSISLSPIRLSPFLYLPPSLPLSLPSFPHMHRAVLFSLFVRFCTSHPSDVSISVSVSYTSGPLGDARRLMICWRRRLLLLMIVQKVTNELQRPFDYNR